MTEYIKVNNLTITGQPDYKGINVDDIRGAVYPQDLSVAYIIVYGNVPEHEDLIEITEQDYTSAKLEIESSIVIPSSTEDLLSEIGNLKEENEALKKSQADQDELLMQLMLTTGGN